MTIKEREKNQKSETLNNAKKTAIFKSFLDYFPDAELINIQNQNDEKQMSPVNL